MSYEGLGYMLCPACIDPKARNEEDLHLICERCGLDILAKRLPTELANALEAGDLPVEVGEEAAALDCLKLFGHEL